MPVRGVLAQADIGDGDQRVELAIQRQCVPPMFERALNLFTDLLLLGRHQLATEWNFDGSEDLFLGRVRSDVYSYSRAIIELALTVFRREPY